MGSINIGNYEITKYFTVQNVSRPLPKVVSEFARSDVAEYSKYLFTSYESPTVTFEAVATHVKPEEQRALIRTLAQNALFKEARRLTFSDDAGLFYLVVPNGNFNVVENLDSVIVKLSYKSITPWMYGAYQSVQGSYNNSVTRTIEVQGGYPTPLIFSGTITADANGRWGFYWRAPSVDNTRRGFTFTDLEPNKTVSVYFGDDNNMITTIASALHGPSALSKWPVVYGNTTFEQAYGSSALGISYYPRWL